MHSKLKESAERNRRSLNGEILARLESDFVAPTVDAQAHARKLKVLVARLPKVEHRKVTRYKRQGRT
ncbi:MAG: Arc family DNA-binding protein [Burkholderiales bacterium]